MRKVAIAAALICLACDAELPTAPRTPRRTLAATTCDAARGYSFEPPVVAPGSTQTAAFTWCGMLTPALCPCYFFSDNSAVLNVIGFLPHDGTTAEVLLIGKSEGSATLMMSMPNFTRAPSTLYVATIDVTSRARRRAARH
jgi:hypothetical protein